MISRVYIDNYKCFTNFEWKPGSFSLLLGENGSGKSTVFDVILRVALFARGLVDTATFGPKYNKTAWDSRAEQTFELQLRTDVGEFTYQLVLRHSVSGDSIEVVSEELHVGPALLYQRALGAVNLFGEDGSPIGNFPFTGPRSLIAMMAGGASDKRLHSFAQAIDSMLFFKPNPLAITSVSDSTSVPNTDMSNVVGWLVHLGAMSADFASRLLQDLREVLPGLLTYGLPPAGINARALQLQFQMGDTNSKSAPVTLFPEQLSDGQRMLLAIYTILHGAIGHRFVVLIDEPDNYLSSREVQPWLRAIEEKLDEHGGQVLMISHHPEAMNYLAPAEGTILYRENNGPVRAKRFEWDEADSLSPAGAIARGWIE